MIAPKHLPIIFEMARPNRLPGIGRLRKNRHINVQKMHGVQVAQTVSRFCACMVNNDRIDWCTLLIGIWPCFCQIDHVLLQRRFKKVPDLPAQFIQLSLLSLAISLSMPSKFIKFQIPVWSFDYFQPMRFVKIHLSFLVFFSLGMKSKLSELMQ